MPLVIFNFNGALEGNPQADKLKQTLILPEDAYNKRWTLRAVNAVQARNPPEDFRHFEFEIPELMSAQNVVYGSQTVGNVRSPTNAFRFYPVNYQVSDFDAGIVFRHHSASTFVSEYPNWDLGEHRLESNELTCIVSSRVGNTSNGSATILNSYSIILSYE